MQADVSPAPADLTLTSPGDTDACIKHGESLLKKIESYRGISEIARLHLLLLSLTEGQLGDSLKRLSTASKTAAQEQELRAVLRQLQDLLDKIETELPSRLERLFSLKGYKRKIQAACNELQTCEQRLYRRGATQLSQGTAGASELRQNNRSTASSVLARVEQAKLASQGSRAGQAIQLPALDTTTVTLQQLDKSSIYLVDGTQDLIEFYRYDSLSDTRDPKIAKKVVRDLAGKLSNVEPAHMGLLSCNGFSPAQARTSFAMHYQHPPGKHNPRTLRHLLTSPDRGERPLHSLSERVDLALKLASALLYIHACDFVHKNIRPDNIVIFDPVAPAGADPAASTYPAIIGDPYLVGFDSLRTTEGTSVMRRDANWEKDLYRHPDRHRMGEGDASAVRHDLYSLGVVLLEIALWGSFADGIRGGLAHLLWREKDVPVKLSELQGRYLELAKTEVPRVMGDKYRDVVVSCLEGLRDEEEGGLLKDQERIFVPDAYISQVMSKLEQIFV